MTFYQAVKMRDGTLLPCDFHSTLNFVERLGTLGVKDKVQILPPPPGAFAEKQS